MFRFNPLKRLIVTAALMFAGLILANVSNASGVFGMQADGVVYHLDGGQTASFVYLCVNDDCRTASKINGRYERSFSPVNAASSYSLEFKIQDNATGQCITNATVKPGEAVTSTPCFVGNALTDTTVEMFMVDAKGVGASVGQVIITESKYGIVFSPSMKGLPPGLHGFHLHQNASCEPMEKDGKMVPALAAGGHYDPADSKHHDTPWGDGHLGDLPALFVDFEGNASEPVLAPRIKMADLSGRSLMAHVNGDNHADHPVPLGGGGTRMVCGVIK